MSLPQTVCLCDNQNMSTSSWVSIDYMWVIQRQRIFNTICWLTFWFFRQHNPWLMKSYKGFEAYNVNHWVPHIYVCVLLFFFTFIWFVCVPQQLPDLVTQLGVLYHMIESRVKMFHKLTKLHGKLYLLMTQVGVITECLDSAVLSLNWISTT